MPSAQINQPSNQIRLTNVALVRLKKGKKRFEVACYPNKISDWREGYETDLDNVLQVPGQVFYNVSKGAVAPNDDLKKAFGAMTKDEIILEILKKGEQQIGQKERSVKLERIHNEVLDIVAGKLVDPKSGGVYTTGIIDKALDQLSSQGGHAAQSEDPSAAADPSADGAIQPETKPKPMWTGVSTTKTAKSQALEAMKALIAHQPIPVARARMRLRITCPTGILKQAVKTAAAPTKTDDKDDAEQEDKAKGTVKDRILSFVEQVENQDVMGDEWEVVGFVEPGNYKPLTELIGTQTKGRARAEVLDMAVTHNDDD